MGQKRENVLVHSAFLLTASGFIAKIFASSYRIFLQNVTGDVSVYIYQQIYPLLSFAMLLALYGFPSAISTLRHRYHFVSFKRFNYSVLVILMTAHFLFSVVLYILAPLITKWIGDPSLTNSYKLSALLFLIVPFISLLRGILQSESYVSPVAISQIVEQFVRVLIIIAASFFVYKGFLQMYSIASAAVVANIVSLVIAFFVLVYFIKNKSKEKVQVKETAQINWKEFIKSLFFIAFAATLNHTILIMMQMVDSLLVLPQLLQTGKSFMEATIEKGIFDRGQPLIQIGSVLGSSFALAILPAISKYYLHDQIEKFEQQIHTAFKCSFILSSGATIGLIILFPRMNEMLFKDQAGTTTLQFFMISLLLSSLLMTGIAVLQGLKLEKITIGIVILGICMKTLLNVYLIPILNTMGIAISTVVSLFLMVIMVFYFLKKKLPSGKIFGNHFFTIQLLKSTLFLILFTYFIYKLSIILSINNRLLLFIYLCSLSTLGAVIFLYSVIKGNIFAKEELEHLPFFKFLQKSVK